MNTVSRALRNEPNVKAETRFAIQALARTMGYVPNTVAKSLRLGRTNTIGVVSADSSNPFFAEVILGIEEIARSEDYQILLANTEESREREREAIDMLVERQVDGLLLMPVCGEESNADLLSSLELPFILVGRWLPGFQNRSVLSDEYDKAKEITARFIEAGHRDILHLAGPAFVSSTFDRQSGYRDALFAADLPVRDDLIVPTDGHSEDGYRQVCALVRADRRFTAIVAFNDLVALGALRALKESGIRVPRDVEVMGFDDLDYSRFLHHSLSSVSLPKRQIGRTAFMDLLGHMRDPALPYAGKVLESRIALRETTLLE